MNTNKKLPKNILKNKILWNFVIQTVPNCYKPEKENIPDVPADQRVKKKISELFPGTEDDVKYIGLGHAHNN